MPDTKITALTALTAADPANDVLPIVDVSDTTMAASGTTKKISINNVLGCSGTATLASATITGDLTVDTNTLKVDSANNRVGIVKTTPAYPLDVGGRISYSGGIGESTDLTVSSSGTSLQLGLGSSWTQQIFYLAGSEAMRLNSTGLGVGVSPTNKFDVNGNASFTGFGINANPQNPVSTTQRYTRLQNTGGDFYTGIESSVAGAFFPNSTAYSACLYNAANVPMHFYTNSALRMTLDASGALLVGTTTAGGNRLNVQTASGDCTTLIKSQAANVNSAIDYVSSYGNHTIRKSGTAVWDYGVINDASATPAFKISNASAVGVQLVSGATAWTTLSDETVKDIIEPIGNAVSKVGSLRSVIGKFKTDSEGTRRSFLIAQDVKSVLPEAVDVVGENNELGLRYTEVIPLLVAAIKELTAEVNALKNA
jgi:hypothetical protein